MTAARTPLPAAALLLAPFVGCDGPAGAARPDGVVSTEPSGPAEPAEPAASTDVVDDEPAGVIEPVAATVPVEETADAAPRFEREGDAVRISYDDLDLLKLGVERDESVPADAVERLPGWLTELEGKRVRLRGFMYPPSTETVKGFMFARDNQLCCFGRDPKIYDLFPVRLKPGTESDYIQNRPFDVVGTFHIRPERDGGEWYQIYGIDDAVVID